MLIQKQQQQKNARKTKTKKNIKQKQFSANWGKAN